MQNGKQLNNNNNYNIHNIKKKKYYRHPKYILSFYEQLDTIYLFVEICKNSPYYVISGAFH